jgi:hypothetical protein
MSAITLKEGSGMFRCMLFMITAAIGPAMLTQQSRKSRKMTSLVEKTFRFLKAHIDRNFVSVILFSLFGLALSLALLTSGKLPADTSLWQR